MEGSAGKNALLSESHRGTYGRKALHCVDRARARANDFCLGGRGRGLREKWFTEADRLTSQPPALAQSCARRSEAPHGGWPDRRYRDLRKSLPAVPSLLGLLQTRPCL